MKFDGYIAIDWSGDKQKFQKGIKVAIIYAENNSPKIVKPPEKFNYWSRNLIVNWIENIISNNNYLIGIDFAFAYPFYDFHSYFPGLNYSPNNPLKLWQMIESINKNQENFYGGQIWKTHPYLNFYNSPIHKGNLFKSRRRKTEIVAKSVLSPSPTFNCVGPGAVGTGSLSGMRLLNYFKQKINIWPFDIFNNVDKSIMVEIFPSYYFRKMKIKPQKPMGYSIQQLNKGLELFETNGISSKIKFTGPDQDEADAIISVAALKYFAKIKQKWKVNKEAKKEGWIFGV